ncbi:pseudouridylate synthase I [Belliella baltica DSM 15883]|uniref:tRNA pseudouridine synthase A n=1 Tax=Belliella baltica (strain DSM 15883 / CIP 108006 / LMG 21964 / BA134) TaxID=866536 RepID=I3Z0Y4_BELBD|nr:tRNA pseudouridine(38-40) synthase TruA [Belliella baltica]AFL82902.1 pseudouridylate synthase I [Belliella baltica DSM 15883]
MDIKRYFLEIAYKGTNYHGWQTQKNAVSVQGAIENALSILLKTPIIIMGSGRTDTGVHATQQFAHFDFEGELNQFGFLKKINSLLPKDIAVYSLREVKHEAHARFSATIRSYVYKITTRKTPFEEELSWHYFRELEIQKMNEAARLLLDHEDFQCFSRVKTDVNHFGCKIKEAYWEQIDHELLFHITSNRFLRGMVRAIVGTLTDVGEGKLSTAKFKSILESKNRDQASSSAPARGLFLCKVHYPQDIFI